MKNHKKTIVLLWCFLAIALACPLVLEAEDLTVSPAALLPVANNIMNMPFYKWDNTFYFTSSSSTYDDAFMIAPLNLPSGVSISRLTVYVTRNTSDGDIYLSIYLNRQNLATGAVQTMAYIPTWSLPASPNRQVAVDATISYPLIDNTQYSYSLSVGFSRPVNTLKFHGAKITW